MKYFFLSAFIIIGADLAQAGSNIYACVNANGTKTFSNVGDNKGCEKVDLPGLTTFPAPNMKMKRAGGFPTPPGDFPTVDDATQRNRDAGRKQILGDELKSEQKKLVDLNTEYKNGEPDRLGGERNYAKYQERTENLKQDINRSQQNIESLQREINGLD